MRGFLAACAAALLVLTVSCGGKSATAPGPATFTETFTGTVGPGATSFGDSNRNHFTIHQPGDVTATITRMSPTAVTIGLGVGLFNGGTCTLQKVADAAGLNMSLNLTAQVAGEFCVGVYDSGSLQTPIDYTVTVVHT